MKKRGWWLSCIAGAMALGAGCFAAWAQQTETPVFRAETHLVELTFSVRRADGVLVRGLGRDDFRVTEDGVPQTIAFFGKETDLPLTLGLLVDASDSQSKFYKRHRKDIEKFLKTVVQPQDEVFSICFGDHLRLTNDNTPDAAKVLDGLKRFDDGDRHFPELAAEDSREGGTAVNDAVYYSVQERLAKAQGRRRALVLFTDGEENSSAHDLLDAIDAARESDTLIYAIRYTNEKEEHTAHARQGTAVLHHMASETGGADYDALHTNVKDAFAQIAEELRSLYSIAYHSTHKTRDGSFHRVQITTENGDYTVRARTGYYAR
ncbi:MAG: VWA domain-containing protein [Terracidiphilus sp.]|nr:VWA domain-containing protein [Terracidiphilus sp.]